MTARLKLLAAKLVNAGRTDRPCLELVTATDSAIFEAPCAGAGSGLSVLARLASLALAVACALAAGGCRGATGPLLEDRAAELGVQHVYATGKSSERWLPEIMGGGVAVFDADGDGALDLYFTNGNDHLLEDRDGGGSRNRFYRQVAGGGFVDATQASGLGDGRYGQGVAVGDVDNDGDLDVYVTNVGADQLYRNDGAGRFERVTEQAGIDVDGYSASATFCDYDRDGWLDLYVTRYVLFDPEVRCFDPAGRRDFCGPQSYRGAPDVLLRNEGEGRFTDVTLAAGLEGPGSTGLGVVCEDVNEDGWPDFLVANDGYANHLWLNQGDGRFVESAIRMGIAYDRSGDTEAGMGILAADFDGDLRLDVFMTHLRNETNTLYRGLGAGLGFDDATQGSGTGPTTMPFTGFGVAAMDLELDGDLDLIVANGRVSSHNVLHPSPAVDPPLNVLAESNLVLLGTGDGRFETGSKLECPPCQSGEISRGVATGDLDADGDLDVVVANIESPARIYLNQSRRAGRWLRVRAVDPRLRRDAIGARVTAVVGERRWLRTVTAGGSYLSASEPIAHFGLGLLEPGADAMVEVVWPDGLEESFAASCLDCVITLRRGEGDPLR
jgi:hypothetical protein